MKYFKFLLPLLFFACGSPDQEQSREMSFAAALAPAPILDSQKITPNGDTIIYRHTVETGTYIYNLPSVEVRLKGTITPPVNQAPVARIVAVPTSITLPLNTVNLNGVTSTDADGTIASWLWQKTAGPPVGGIANASAVSTDVSGLTTAGTYTYRLTVTDNKGATGSTTVNIVVNPEIVTPPTGNNLSFSFVKNTAFKKRAFAGTEDWNGQYYTSFAGGPSDKYFRFVWCDIEKVTQGNYVWTRFDQEFNKAIAFKGKFAFGVFMLNDSDDFLAQEFFNGTSARYPKYVHDRMQSESAKDFVRNGQWVPNWNSTFMLDRYEAMLKAIQAHIVSKGWQDKVNYVDIRGYGQWGEWHSVSIVNNMSEYPSGTRPTVATYKKFIDSHIAAFPDYPLVMLLAALDANWLNHTLTPPEVTAYILTAKNNWGLIGIRRDQWGATDNYVHDYLENNNRSFGNSGAFSNIIKERWKYAPWVGEPMGPGSNLADLPRQALFYHAASIGNGNYSNNTTSMNQFREAENNSGYKLAFQNGTFKSTGFTIDITLNVENFGNATCYENFDLVYELKNSSGATTWTSTSSWHPLLKLPGTHPIADRFLIPGQSPGTYVLSASIKNSYRSMALFNNGQDANGYIVLSNQVKF